MSGSKLMKKRMRDSQPIPVDLDNDFGILPDDIIGCILSRLTLKEAVRTSVLSSRWKNLWRHRFDTGSIVLSVELKPVPTVMSQESFVEWVNKLLKLYKNQPIHEFVLQYFLNRNLITEVGPWLEFALRNNVERLYLASGWFCEFPDLRQLVTLSPLFSSVVDVSLSEFRIEPSVFNDLLSRLPNLKRLSLRNIYGIRDLNIAGETIKCLEVQSCSNLKRLVVSAPNIASLNCEGHWTNLRLGNLPLLSEFSISVYPYAFFLDNKNIATQLTTLMFCLDGGFKCDIFNYHPVSIAFPALKHMEIVMDVYEFDSLLWPIRLMKNAPKLHKFKIEMKTWRKADSKYRQHLIMLPGCHNLEYYNKPAESIWNGQMAKSGEHKFLKVAELHGFATFANQWELFKQIIEIAENLEVTVLDIYESYDDFAEDSFVGNVRTIAETMVAPPTKLIVRNSIKSRELQK